MSYAQPETPLREIANLMEKHSIKRVPIVQDELVVGIVSRANLLQVLARANDNTDWVGRRNGRASKLERGRHRAANSGCGRSIPSANSRPNSASTRSAVPAGLIWRQRQSGAVGLVIAARAAPPAGRTAPARASCCSGLHLGAAIGRSAIRNNQDFIPGRQGRCRSASIAGIICGLRR